MVGWFDIFTLSCCVKCQLENIQKWISRLGVLQYNGFEVPKRFDNNSKINCCFFWVFSFFGMVFGMYRILSIWSQHRSSFAWCFRSYFPWIGDWFVYVDICSSSVKLLTTTLLHQMQETATELLLLLWIVTEAELFREGYFGVILFLSDDLSSC